MKGDFELLAPELQAADRHHRLLTHADWPQKKHARSKESSGRATAWAAKHRRERRCVRIHGRSGRAREERASLTGSPICQEMPGTLPSGDDAYHSSFSDS